MPNPQTRIYIIIVMAILLFGVTPSLVRSVSATPQSSTGIVVPLYGYPSSDWNNVVQAKLANPSVPIVAVINPANGPGTWQNPNFVSGIQQLQSAGVIVLGYVWTNYGSRSLSSVESDVLAYHNLYGISGIYADQMSNVPGYEWYYSDLTSYAKSTGMWLVMGNPGADVPSSYIGTVDSMVIYENSGEPSLSFLGGWHTGYSKSNFGIVAYNVGWLDASFVQGAAADLGWIYLTNGGWPNPYSSVSSYIGALAATLAGSSPTSPTSSSPQAVAAPVSPSATLNAGAGSISVVTVNPSGSELWGLDTTLWQNGVPLQSCYSPCTFSVGGGQSYSVSVANWGAFTFIQWGNGVQTKLYPISEPGVPTAVTLWAVYS